MISYLINSILCSTLLIAAYYLFLERETVHRFKRWYLLSTLIVSLTVPLITVELEQAQLTTHFSNISKKLSAEIPLSVKQADAEPTVLPATDSGFPWLTAVLIGYGVITSILLVRIIHNFLSILSNVNSRSVVPYREAMLVLHPNHIIPHSFLNYIFISHQDSSNNQILLHELTHIRQRHTLDILLVEFVHCLMWFNPAIIFYKKAIRLNHEFLADEVVIKSYPTTEYQNLLFQKVQLSNQQILSSSLNYSATKKRFIMMNTVKNQLRSMIKVILSLAIISCAVIIFPERTYSQPYTQQVLVVQDTSVSLSDSVEFDILVEGLKQVRFKKNGESYICYDFTTLHETKRNG